MKQFLIFLLVFCQLFTSIPAFGQQRILTADIIEGQDSGKNYAGNKGHFEKNVNGISAYADAAGVSAVDGTGGAPTVTCTRTTSSPISGDGMLLITKDAANRQGNGCSMAFSIDSGDKATMQQIEFQAIVPSGTFVAGTETTNSDIIVQVYDVTNAAIIPVQGTGRLYSNSSTLAEPFKGYFQTAPNSTSYRLIWHVTSTSASAYTVGIDNVKIQKSKVALGAMITEWQSWTPTGGWSANTTYTGKWRRVGDTGEYQVNVATSGAPTSATLSINLPSGHVMDTTKMDGTSTHNVIGYARVQDSGSAVYHANVRYNNTTSVTAINLGAAGTYVNEPSVVDQATPITFGASDAVGFRFSAPIVGWAATTQIANGYSGRQIAFSAYLSATTSFNNTTIVYNTETIDKTNSYSTSTGTFTAPETGLYLAVVQGFSDSTTVGIALQKNGSGIARSYQTSTANDDYAHIVKVVEMTAGDTLRVNTDGNYSIYGGAVDNYFEVYMLSSPGSMGMTEKFAFMAEGASSSALGTNTVIPFNTPSEDTHACWNSTNKDCAVPYSGTYKITCAARATFAGASVNQYFDVIIQVDTVTKREFVKYLENTGVAAISAITSYQARLTAGQKVRCLGDTNLTAGTLTTGATHTYMEIALIK